MPAPALCQDRLVSCLVLGFITFISCLFRVPVPCRPVQPSCLSAPPPPAPLQPRTSPMPSCSPALLTDLPVLTPARFWTSPYPFRMDFDPCLDLHYSVCWGLTCVSVKLKWGLPFTTSWYLRMVLISSLPSNYAYSVNTIILRKY